MIISFSIRLYNAFTLVICVLLVNQVLCSSENSTEPSTDKRNETLNNEIGDNLLDKKLSKDLKNYLRAFNEEKPTPTYPNESIENKSNSSELLLNHHSNSTNSSTTHIINLNENSNITSTIKIDNETLTTNSLNNFNVSNVSNSSIESIESTSQLNFNETSTSRPVVEKEYVFRSLCSLTNNQVEGCDRYECNNNSCYCNRAFDLTVPLKSNWPIKYLCLNKLSYNEDCLTDEQCSGKHQVCSSKKSFQNYLNNDLNFSSVSHKLKDLFNASNETINQSNDTLDLNRQFFVQQMSILYNQTKLNEFKGKCRCRSGYFYNYYLSYIKNNKHFNKQFNSFLIESNSSNISDQVAKQKHLFNGQCWKVRKLDEPCESNSECQMHDPSSVCRKSKCKCKTGYQVELEHQIDLSNNQTAKPSILINKLTNFTTLSSKNNTKLVCEPILNLNLELSHHHNGNDKSNHRNDSSFNYQQLNRNNVQIIKNLLNKNCSDELIICEGRHNCVKKSKRLHVQENFAR